MQLPSTPRIEFLRGLVAEIAHNYGRGRVMIAVDGDSAAGSRGAAGSGGAHVTDAGRENAAGASAGTASFADDLAAVFREAGHTAFRASIGDFHSSRAVRDAAGEESPESYYRDAFDYRTLRRVLIDPFRMAGSTGFQTSAFDERRDAPTQSRWLTAPADAVLIIDGVFLNRPELRDLWNFSILLDDPSLPGGALAPYFADTDPRTRASAIVDNSDPDAPRRVFADGC
ncbi:MAG: uridine kinase [Microbacteriaceae bacterium]|nr:uridine kinase [Microbacteriaceae bacterium]